MSVIRIEDIQNPVGFNLFSDTDSYLSELSNDEAALTRGAGFWFVPIVSFVVTMNLYGGYKHGRQDRR